MWRIPLTHVSPVWRVVRSSQTKPSQTFTYYPLRVYILSTASIILTSQILRPFQRTLVGLYAPTGAATSVVVVDETTQSSLTRGLVWIVLGYQRRGEGGSTPFDVDMVGSFGVLLRTELNDRACERPHCGAAVAVVPNSNRNMFSIASKPAI